MEKIKQRTLQKQQEKGARLQKVMKAAKAGDFPSLRHTAEAYDITLTILRR